MNSKKIFIPDSLNGRKEVESTQSFVIVGANGSGKSHLGAWIENNNNNVLRISAQRSLSIPDVINIKDRDASWNKIYYGHETSLNKSIKWNYGKETSSLIYDYESVLSMLFSEDYSQLRKNNKDSKKTGTVEFKETITDIVEGIWKDVMPQRQLELDRFDVKAKYGEELYKAGGMSDGERVCLYLIAQCLLVPDNYIIVIDEPELHLHLSIMKRLWDKIESSCPNKTFVYITHNLEFATTRAATTKIWVKSFDGHGKWELYVIDKDEIIPDELLLEILGTRRPVLFVEGEKNSYDTALYKEVFENHYVIACHNCQKVIELTKAFNNDRVQSLHSYEVKGLIDHDYLSTEEIESYNRQNVYPINVSEVENLFLIEPLIKLAAKQIGENPEDTFTKVSDYLFKNMAANQNSIINAICVKEIRHLLNGFSSEGQSETDIQSDLNNLLSRININALYNLAKTCVSDILCKKDYKSLIKFYNNKGLCKQVSSIIGFKKPYPQIILDLIKGEKRNEIITAIKEYLPNV